MQVEGNKVGRFTPWTDYPTLFFQAHMLGANTAIISYYHPYSRIFNGNYSFCSWYGVALKKESVANSFYI